MRIATLHTQESNALVIPVVGCTLRQAFAKLERAGKLPADSSYLVDLAGGQPDPRWDLTSAVPMRGKIGSVDAATCAIASK